ncbi:MAG: TonB-dependent receptor plug domain-containing protein, partial [Planctomycetota bacterium]
MKPSHHTLLAVLMCCAAAAPAAAQEASKPKAEEPAKPAEQPAEPPADPPADAPAPAAPAAGDETPARLPTTAVIASRTTRPTLRTPRALTILSREDIESRGGQVLVNALHERMGLWIEHRTGTTGDVVMRGLSGGNILSLIDGCSLSTFWGEGGFAGDDMYGKVDPGSIERIEVVRGPASVMYGSQALGGVINFISREVPFDFEEGGRVGLRQQLRVASADESIRYRSEAIFASSFMRGYLGFTAADVNEVVGGRGVGLQANTGGREWNWDGKLEFLPAEEHLFTFTFRDVNRRDIRRYYRPTQNNANDFTSLMARWRLAAPWGGMHEAQAHVHYQKKVDTRYWENDPNGRMGAARTETYTAGVQGSWKIGPEGNTLTTGVDAHLDVGESADDEEFTERRNSWSVGPAGERTAGPGTQWWNIGWFVHDAWDIGPVTAEASARADYFEFATDPFSSRYYPTSYTGAGTLEASQAPDDMRDGSFALTGGLGLSWEFVENGAIFVNGSRGYRQWAPRFGFAQIGPGILAPSPDLPDPVISYSAEA